MGIDLQDRHGNMGLVLVCYGTFTGNDLIQVHKQLLASPDLLKSVKYVLVDETAVDSVDISPSDLQQIAEQDKQLMQYFPPKLSVAIIATRDFQYGLARMWEVLVAETGWDVSVFRALPEAVSWIHLQVKGHFDIDLPAEPEAV